MTTVSPRITAKIAALLATVQQEVRAGNLEAARVASASASEVAKEDGRVRVYVVWHKTAECVQEMRTAPTSLHPDFWQWTADKAWSHHLFRAVDRGLSLSPMDYVVVGCIHSGVVDDGGAHEFLPDWADCTNATDLAS